MTRFLYHNCSNPTIKGFEIPGKDMKYKAAWDMLNKIKKEVFSAEELEALKAGSASKGGEDSPAPKTKSTPKRKANAADGPTPTPKRGKKARKEVVAEEGSDSESALVEEQIRAEQQIKAEEGESV
jgi:hypothetical protein